MDKRMEKQGTILAVFAHPDDEGVIGGTLAKCRDEGHPVTLICLTPGQAGKSSDPTITTPEALAVRREKELREACRILDISDLRLWNYMDGELNRADSTEVVGRLLRVMREVRPEVVITFGPDGIYGHPDHVAAHEYAKEAYYAYTNQLRNIEISEHGRDGRREPKLYYTVFPRKFFDGPNPRRHSRTMEIEGVVYYFHAFEENEISTILDVSDYIDQKIAAFLAHRSQALPGSTRADFRRESMVKHFAMEYLVRIEPHWDGETKESNIFYQAKAEKHCFAE